MPIRARDRLELIALPGIPLVRHGDDLGAILAAAIDKAGLRLADGDVLVVAQKIVSKAEGREIALDAISPSAEAIRIARLTEKDPRLVEVILSESSGVVRAERNVIITRHRLGFVMANAGVDQSNVAAEGDHKALMLPADPDASAERLRGEIARRLGAKIAVVINDSFGRPWRRGTVGVAIGAAGLECLVDKRGTPDLFGRPLKVTTIARADEIAAAASLLMGQAGEGLPAVLVRGLAPASATNPARELVRPAEEDLFR